MIIEISDLLPPNAPWCPHGARIWFKYYGLDFRKFLKDGIEAEILLATGDALAEKAVALKRSRINEQEVSSRKD